MDLGWIWDGFGSICCTLSVFFVGSALMRRSVPQVSQRFFSKIQFFRKEALRRSEKLPPPYRASRSCSDRFILKAFFALVRSWGVPGAVLGRLGWSWGGL